MNKNETRHQWNAQWRARDAEKKQAILDEFNSKRKELNLPTVSLVIEHECPFKGKTKPTYMPPPEEEEKMSQDELKEWKRKERLKRKALMQRENRKKKAKMFNDIMEELPELERKVEEKKMSKLECNKKKDCVAKSEKNCGGNTEAGSSPQEIRLNNNVVSTNTSKSQLRKFDWEDAAWVHDKKLFASVEPVPAPALANAFGLGGAPPTKLAVVRTNMGIIVNNELYVKLAVTTRDKMISRVDDNEFASIEPAPVSTFNHTFGLKEATPTELVVDGINMGNIINDELHIKSTVAIDDDGICTENTIDDGEASYGKLLSELEG